MNLPPVERLGEGVMSYVQCRLGGYVGCEEFWFRDFQSGKEKTEVSTSIRCLLWEIERWCEESVYSSLG